MINGWRYSLSIMRAARSLDGLSYTIEEPVPLYCESSCRELYFVFCDTQKHVFSFMCRPGYQHVYLLERLEHVWLMYNPTRMGLSVTLPPCEANHDLISKMIELDSSIDVVGVVLVGEQSLERCLRPINCVTLCCNIAGIKVPWWCVTPWQLRKVLLQSSHPNIFQAWSLCQPEDTKHDDKGVEPKKQQRKRAWSVSNWRKRRNESV